MIFLKQKIKNIFLQTNSLSVLDKINYAYSKLKHSAANKKFKKLNPNFTFPPDYYLYETYKLDYRQYKKDGEITAKEILEWTTKYIYDEQLKILEWGCGVARIIRHIPNLVDNAAIFGTDINQKMTDWNSNNIDRVIFSAIEYYPPTHFNNDQFNLIFAISVFTHIEVKLQSDWLTEINRIIADNGVFLFTTQGKKYETNLNEKQKDELDMRGALTINYKQKGHRMMSSYNKHKNLKILVEKYFEVLEYYDGLDYPDKIGGQDLWIVRKK